MRTLYYMAMRSKSVFAYCETLYMRLQKASFSASTFASFPCERSQAQRRATFFAPLETPA